MKFKLLVIANFIELATGCSDIQINNINTSEPISACMTTVVKVYSDSYQAHSKSHRRVSIVNGNNHD